VTVQPPHKITDTKHAGQQSLRVRSDGRLLVTGGWDARIRIYSAKTLKEVAVLKWHKEGVYAVGFSKILKPEVSHTAKEESLSGSVTRTSNPRYERERKLEESSDSSEKTDETMGKTSEIMRKERPRERLDRLREAKTMLTHWVAAGAKDGKVSLWEVF
jgi:hypothetical protein